MWHSKIKQCNLCPPLELIIAIILHFSFWFKVILSTYEVMSSMFVYLWFMSNLLHMLYTPVGNLLIALGKTWHTNHYVAGSTIVFCRCFHWIVWSEKAVILVKSCPATFTRITFAFMLPYVCLLLRMVLNVFLFDYFWKKITTRHFHLK